MHRELDTAGRAIISWYLALQGIPDETVEGLFDALRSGLANEEADSIAYVDQLVANARTVWQRDPDPDLPDRLFEIHAELRARADVARDLERLSKVAAILEVEPTSPMGLRVQKMKAAAALEGR